MLVNIDRGLVYWGDGGPFLPDTKQKDGCGGSTTHWGIRMEGERKGERRVVWCGEGWSWEGRDECGVEWDGRGVRGGRGWQQEGGKRWEGLTGARDKGSADQLWARQGKHNPACPSDANDSIITQPIEYSPLYDLRYSFVSLVMCSHHFLVHKSDISRRSAKNWGILTQPATDINETGSHPRLSKS